MTSEIEHREHVVIYLLSWCIAFGNKAIYEFTGDDDDDILITNLPNKPDHRCIQLNLCIHIEILMVKIYYELVAVTLFVLYFTHCRLAHTRVIFVKYGHG